MRVLQVHTRYRQGGGEDVVVETDAALLQAVGVDVERFDAHNPDAVLPALGRLAAAPHNPLGARAVARAIRRNRPDVVHLHNTWFALSPAVVGALRRAETPIVMTLHNYRLTCANSMLFRDGHPCEDCVQGTAAQAVRHACYRGSRLQSIPAAATIGLARSRSTWTRGVDRFLVLTNFSRALHVRAGIPAAKLTLRANAVPDPGPRLIEPSKSRTVLFVGRLSPEKGLAVVLEAWRQRPPLNLELLIVGEGPQRTVLEGIAPPGVRFLGRQTKADVSDMMRQARALVLPSLWYEGQPMTLLEAFAAGLPVRVSALGGAGETAAGLGPLVPPADVDAWANALTDLQDDRVMDAEGLSVRERWHERHRPDDAGRALLRVYEDVCAQRGRTA